MNRFRDEVNKRQELVEVIRRDILNIGCIYPTVGKALFEEATTRLAERIASTTEKRHACLLASCKEMLECTEGEWGPTDDVIDSETLTELGADGIICRARVAIAEVKGDKR